MKADKLTLERVFERTERLEAPLFQRPYVWKKEHNWLPLWESIQKVAEKRSTGVTTRPHFLGTIVLDQLKTPTGKIHARQIIDGQQRLTTLQLALAAARDLCCKFGHDPYAQAFKKFTDNHVPLSDDPDDVFKVWPTNADREDFRDVMGAGAPEEVRRLPHSDPEDLWLIPDAYLYFSDRFADWLGPTTSEDFMTRLDAFYETLKSDLHVVVIDLEENDDPQLIFETLNALGTPLLPADLVKNYLFHKAEGEGEDTHKLHAQFWRTFDTDKAYWRKEVRQGRLKRARLDLFLGHYLTMNVGEDVSIPHLFSTFRDFVEKANGKSAATHTELFRSYADVYRSFDECPSDSREELFFRRLRQMDTTTVYPLLLEVFKRHPSAVTREDLETILVDLESFLVRRAVCQLTPKNYNRLFADMTKQLRGKNDFSASAVRAFLLAQTAETARWPQDEEFKTSWLFVNFYTRLRAAKTRMVLEAIEAALYTGKTERVQIQGGLTIEHLLPRGWQEQDWPLQPGNATSEELQEATRFRNEMVHTIGNLTLLTKKLNPAISNGSWAKKRTEILKHSALTLNRAFQDVDAWNELLIHKRSEKLFEYTVPVWPHPGGDEEKKGMSG